MKPIFSDGSAVAYAELPVKSNYLRWTRGNAQLRNSIDSDPAVFYGGWRASVTTKDGTSMPELPLPIVERVSEDGKHIYKSYASNVIDFLPIQHRTRFELREKSKDAITGRDIVTIKAVSKEKIQGYTPVRQVFGLVFNGANDAPVILYIDKWNTFISFERAGQSWNKISVPENHALVRRYGSIGEKNSDGVIVPKFETYGEARYTPIDAINTDNPLFVNVLQRHIDLFNASLEWKNCQRWNAVGQTNEVIGETDKQKFIKRANELNLSNVDIEQLLAENNNSYASALEAIDDNPF